MNKCAKFGEDILKRYGLKIGSVGCLFLTFFSLQGDPCCACAKKWCHFSSFSQAFEQRKLKEWWPKITKIASMGVQLKHKGCWEVSEMNCGRCIREATRRSPVRHNWCRSPGGQNSPVGHNQCRSSVGHNRCRKRKCNYNTSKQQQQQQVMLSQSNNLFWGDIAQKKKAYTLPGSFSQWWWQCRPNCRSPTTGCASQTDSPVQKKRLKLSQQSGFCVWPLQSYTEWCTKQKSGFCVWPLQSYTEWRTKQKSGFCVWPLQSYTEWCTKQKSGFCVAFAILHRVVY